MPLSETFKLNPRHLQTHTQYEHEKKPPALLNFFRVIFPRNRKGHYTNLCLFLCARKENGPLTRDGRETEKSDT